jgi:hypothetical protein
MKELFHFLESVGYGDGTLTVQVMNWTHLAQDMVWIHVAQCARLL